MSRASWLFFGIAALAAACANGSEETGSLGEGGAPGPDATAVGPDATSGSDDAPATGEDAGGSTSEDSGSATSEDSGSEDAGSDDSGEDAGHEGKDGGEDSGAGDAGHDSGTTTDAGHDSGTPDAGHDSGTTTDAGQDSGTTFDAGEDAGCSPPVTPAFTKTFHPPASSGICSSTQVGNFYADCLAGSPSACTTWQATNSSCNTCLSGSSSPVSTDWGPYVAYPVSQVDELDLGGCLYFDSSATGSNSNIITCSDDLEYLMECEHAACDAPCSGASINGYDACQTAADGNASLCKSEYDAVYGAGVACANVTSACFGGTDFQSAFTAVAKVMCE